MKNAILIHGWAKRDEFYDLEYPTPSNSHWFPWLTKRLMIKNIHTIAVEMPETYYPVYEKWKKEFERYETGSETILVGHSCGGGFLIRWLSENNVKVGKVVLVAPWLGVEPEQDFDKNFFDFKIDPNLMSKTSGLVVFNSKDDAEVIQQSVKTILGEVKGIDLKEFEKKGHFTLKGLGTEAFPELLEEILS